MSLLACTSNAVASPDLAARLKVHWGLKAVAGTAIFVGFFAIYFPLAYFPVFPVTAMPVTAVDRWIPFWIWSLLIYMTLWFYIPIAPWFMDDRAELISYGRALVGMAVLGLIVFFFWPTSVPGPGQFPAAYQHPTSRLLMAIDRPHNAFPCLHGAFSVFSAISIDRMARRLGGRLYLRFASWIWCAAIMYSVLGTKQHLAVDLLGGSVLGAVWAEIYWRWGRHHRGAGPGPGEQARLE